METFFVDHEVLSEPRPLLDGHTCFSLYITDGWLQQHRVLQLSSLTQLCFCSGVALAYEPFFIGSQIVCLVSSLADTIEAGVHTNPLTVTSRIVQLIVRLSH